MGSDILAGPYGKATTIRLHPVQQFSKPLYLSYIGHP
jgi:hypothetical protein